MGCCMRGDKEGGVPSIRAARKDESEGGGGGMGSKGPRVSERARVSNVPKYHTRLSGKARLRDCHKPGAAAGGDAMMAMSGGGGHDRR